MTRINVIEPTELTRQHLIAEIRELPRIFTLVKNWKGTGVNYYNFKRIKKQPQDYTLGTGHMIHFADKLQWLADRYESLCNEWRSRGYNINQVSRKDLLEGIDSKFLGCYSPTNEAIQINKQRIADRLVGKQGG
jgi:deoxyribonuclease (pyrimidine dimer)